MTRIDPEIFREASEEHRSQLIAIEGRRVLTRAVTLQRAALLVTLAVPILAVRECLQVVAGKHTTVSISLVASISLVGVTGLVIQLTAQHRKLVYARQRITKLEAEIVDLQNKLDLHRPGARSETVDYRPESGEVEPRDEGSEP